MVAFSYAQRATLASGKIEVEYHSCPYTPSEESVDFYLPRSERVAQRMESRQAPCSNFIVTYNGFTPQAEAAFQFAVEIWENELDSSVPIRVNAQFGPLNPGVLGGAGPDGFFVLTGPGIPPNTLFPAPLAEQILGEDTDGPGGTSNDINATFSSTANFYFGTDGNTPPGQIDFVTVVLHELGHGLGVLGLGAVTPDGTQGFIRRDNDGNPATPPVLVSIWDTFIDAEDILNNLIPILDETPPFGFPDPSAALLGAMTSGELTSRGPIAVGQNGGVQPATFAPGTFQTGSSYSHWDEATFNGTQNALMTPSVAPGEAIHQPGEINLGFMEDMGWTLCDRSLSVDEVALEEIEIGPNPFTETITVNIPRRLSNDDYDISIIDVNGRIILTKEASNINGEITLSNLSQLGDALYFLQLTNKTTGNNITRKLVKN